MTIYTEIENCLNKINKEIEILHKKIDSQSITDFPKTPADIQKLCQKINRFYGDQRYMDQTINSLLTNCYMNYDKLKIYDQLGEKRFIYMFNQNFIDFDGETACKLFFKSEKNKFNNSKMIASINEKYKKKKAEIMSTLIDYKTLDNINNVNLQGNCVDIPIISKLKYLPPTFYWFDGDSNNKEGIYCSLCEGCYINVPFPNLYDPSSKKYKNRSIQCKYYDKEKCEKNKQKIASYYGSEIKKCNFVHKGEQYNKVGNIYRCLLERFGNHEYLGEDLEKINIVEIKQLLTNNVSDLLLILVWYQNKYQSGDLFFNNIDIC